MEKHVEMLPIFLKKALILNGLKKRQDFRLMRKDNFDALIGKISDQVNYV